MFTLPFTMTVAKVAQIEVIGTDGPTYNQTAANIGVTLPVGTQEGDLLLACATAASDSGAGSVDGPTTSGWTLLANNTVSLLDDCSIYYKFAGPSEANFQMQFSPGTFSEACTVMLLVLRNADTPTVQFSNTGSAADPLSEAYTEPTDRSWELIYSGHEDGISAVNISSIGGTGYTSLIVDDGDGLGATAAVLSYKKNDGVSQTYQVNQGSTMDFAYHRVRIPVVTPPAPAAPLTYIASSSQSIGAGGGFNVNMPVTPQAGDIIVVVAGSVDAAGSQPPAASISGDTPYATAVSNVITNNARSTLSVHYTTAVGTESSINVSWGYNNVDFRGAAILIYRPVGVVSYDAAPTVSTITTGSGQTTASFTDGSGQTILAWIGNATGTNTLNVSSGPADAVQRQVVDGSPFSQQDKELAVYELVHADRGSITRSLTWNTSLTEGLCGGLGITDG